MFVNVRYTDFSIWHAICQGMTYDTVGLENKSSFAPVRDKMYPALNSMNLLHSGLVRKDGRD